jgi:hypothetical protein
LLALRWIDYDEGACTLAVNGNVIRVAGEGLKRVDDTRSAAGRRVVPVPRFAIEMLRKRRSPNLRCSMIAQFLPQIWLNPWAPMPLTDVDGLATVTAKESGEIVRREAQHAPEAVFGLPTDWPFFPTGKPAAP